jgi:hypothetical protein
MMGGDMQLRGAVAVLATAFTIGGANVRAEQAGDALAPLTVPPLRLTLDPQSTSPTARWRERFAQARVRQLIAQVEAEEALKSKLAGSHGEWNCGMPVVRPPADIDPAFERKPDERRNMPIRRAIPRRCGR